MSEWKIDIEKWLGGMVLWNSKLYILLKKKRFSFTLYMVGSWRVKNESLSKVF